MTEEVSMYEFGDLQDKCRDMGIPYNDAKSVEELKRRLKAKREEELED